MSGKYSFSGIVLALSISIFAQAQPKPEVQILTDEFIFGEAPFKQCHASTLCETADGSLLAAWFGGSYEGANDVCIWVSTKQDTQWEVPRKAVCGMSRGGNPLPCWNPVLFRSSRDTIILYYKQGPNPREWKGMSVFSTDNGLTWSEPVELLKFNGPVKNKPLITQKGTWLNPASTETNDRWQVFVERSADHGRTWEILPVDTSNTARVIQPTLLLQPDGRIQALCRSNQNRIMESWSDDDGSSWSALQATEILNPNSGIDALTQKSGMHLLVYNPAVAGKEWSEGRNHLMVAWSFDGIIWGDLKLLVDETSGEYSYPAIIQTADGAIHISFTHQRTKIRHIAFIIKS